MSNKLIIPAGTMFGMLTVILELPKAFGAVGGQERIFRCSCSCGKITDVRLNHLRAGKIKSCGCFHDSCHITHGYSNTKEYNVWRGMKRRCNNTKSDCYANYGGRGISVCQEWNESFESFLRDMGKCSKGLSLDRIDNNGNYEPGNCRWATRKEQNRNSRHNVNLTLDGLTLPIVEWSEKLGLGYYVIRHRVKAYKWNTERALTTPVKVQNWRAL